MALAALLDSDARRERTDNNISYASESKIAETHAKLALYGYNKEAPTNAEDPC